MKNLSFALLLLAAPLAAELPTHFTVQRFSGISQVSGAIVSGQGQYLVSDASGGDVNAYDASFRYEQSYAAAGAPGRMDLCSSGRIVVVSTDNNTVSVLAPDGSLLFNLGTEVAEDPQQDPATEEFLYQPGDAAFGPNGDIYVADTGHNRVAVFSGQDGHFLRAWGSLGFRGLNVFYLPMGISVSGQRIYVADAGNGRVLCFDPQGNFVQQFGQRGVADDQLDSPFDVAVDNLGRVWVADNGLQKIVVYADSDGAYLGGYTDANGTPFEDPSSIYSADDGHIIIGDGASGLVYSVDTGVVSARYVKPAPAVAAAAVALKDAQLAFGPVPARAGQALVMTLPFKAESVAWELMSVDMRRVAAGESLLASAATVADTHNLESGVYIMRTTVKAEGASRSQIQKIIVTR